MSRLARVLVGVALLCAVHAPGAIAHQGDPNYRSQLRGTPSAPGLELRVLNYDDSLELVNGSGRTVVVEGYEGEPYVRVTAGGTVYVNRSSPAAYLNDERRGEVSVPPSASADAEPRWQEIDRAGRFTWHDHRMHWMGAGRPRVVSDPGKRTKVFDYEIPLRVDGRPASAVGTLWWVGEAGGGMPVGAIVSLAILLVLTVGIVVVTRRRRRRAGHAHAVMGDEAW